MGLRPWEFKKMSHKEFILMMEGYQDKKLDTYKLARNLMFTMVRIWADKGPKTPEELWPLPGDNKEAIKEEEMAAIIQKFAQLREKDGRSTKG